MMFEMSQWHVWNESMTPKKWVTGTYKSESVTCMKWVNAIHVWKELITGMKWVNDRCEPQWHVWNESMKSTKNESQWPIWNESQWLMK